MAEIGLQNVLVVDMSGHNYVDRMLGGYPISSISIFCSLSFFFLFSSTLPHCFCPFSYFVFYRLFVPRHLSCFLLFSFLSFPSIFVYYFKYVFHFLHIFKLFFVSIGMLEDKIFVAFHFNGEFD